MRANPDGTEPIRVTDHLRPDRSHLVGAQDRRFVYFYRRADNWHYPVPKARLFYGVEFQGVWERVVAEAERTCLPVEDVLRRLAGVQRSEELDGLGQQVRLRARRLGLTATEWLALADAALAALHPGPAALEIGALVETARSGPVR